jgi:hypothetical protein
MTSYDTMKSIMNNIGFSDCMNIDMDNNKYDNITPLLLFQDKSKKYRVNNNKNPVFNIPLNVLLGIDNGYKYYLPYDILLEEKCPQGLFCPYKTNPIKCPLNHHDVKSENNILRKGALVPGLLCRYERPWKIVNGEPVLCQNSQCWYNHFKGRVQRINSKVYYIPSEKKCYCPENKKFI